jgi:hypothetical protein
MTLRRFALTILLATVVACSTQSDETQQDSYASSDGRRYFSFLAPTNIVTQAERAFVRAPIAASASLFNLTSSDLAGVSGRYRYDVRYAAPDAFRRRDVWRLDGRLDPGTWLEGASGRLPVFLRLDAGQEIEFVTVHGSKEAAMTALPRTPADLPLTAAKARGMAPGEHVSIPVRMGVQLGVQEPFTRTPLSSVASAGIFWRGQFSFLVHKVDETRVRVKIVPQRSRGAFFSTQVALELSLFGYGPGGFVQLDRQAERFLGLDLARYTRERIPDAETMALDYVFRLTDGADQDQSANAAYESLFLRTLRLNPAGLGWSMLTQDLTEEVFANLDPVEGIAYQDRDLPPDARRVSRVFRGSNVFSQASSSSSLGTKLLRDKSSTSLTFNHLRSMDAEGRETKFVFDAYARDRETQSFFSPLRRTHHVEAQAVFRVDDSWQRPEMLSMAVTTERKEKLLTESEAALYKALVGSVIGVDYYNGLRVPELVPTAEQRDVFGLTKVVFQGDFFRALASKAGTDREMFEKEITWAMSEVLRVFELRATVRPVPTGRPLVVLGNLSAETLASLRDGLRQLVNLRIEGINGPTVDDILRAARDLPARGPVAFVHDMLLLMNRDASAEEIVPAFLTVLEGYYGRTNQAPWPYVSVSHQADGKSGAQASGHDATEDTVRGVLETMRELSSVGYDL